MSPAAGTTPSPEARESWAGDPPRRSAARDRLLEAAVRCVVRDGIVATRVSGVAEEAGVSRPTLYRDDEDRNAPIAETLRHAARRLGAGPTTEDVHVDHGWQ